MDARQLEQTWRNRQRRLTTKAIGDLLQPIHRRVLALAGQVGEVSRAWASVVPESLGERSEVRGLSKGVLRVAVDSSADMYMVQTVHQQELIASINTILGKNLVRRIRCELRRPGKTGNRDKQA